ncbi:T9SS type B sorting domain-containing protein [Flavobacterium degerlachei]|jgi:gliding motility-associated-like protein|uniref:Gliding motility-associated C-terminal domain-containing protein n=1 Tax=Flavobacterium degerlachei TaxID=229203 RepID=A0A1H3ABN0_9FLAO|nr:T9SS type B sorting domain-containing protein [Flavobacterium degerlachei]SDX27043.1 gliding motility-associated C-terminal domain-containing protein [Flavobacterium degerlachei]
MKQTLLIFFTFLSISCFAQFSKTHYIPPLSGAESQAAQEQFLYISTPSVTPVNFKINQLGGTIISGTVSQSTPYTFNAGYGTDSQLHVKESLISTILTNKGYIIEADNVIYVTARVIAGNANQAGALVSKGLAALGTQFRIGALINTGISAAGSAHLTFISILATENNTLIKFSGIKTGVILINNSGGANPSNIILNSGESYVLAVKGPTDSNRDGLIGALVSSDKPIAVNCGSYAGTNGDISLNVDLGFDQIVSAERTGKEYILIKSTGQDSVERALVVANENNTQVFLNGSTTAITTLNAGEYTALNGSDFSAAGNLYIKTSRNSFIYQSVGDNSRIDQANQELFFVPPLSCETPKLIDNIPDLNQIGSRTFTGRVTIVTERNAILTFAINGTPYSLSSLPAFVDGPKLVTGNSNYETYTITGLSGNVSVYSTGQLYLASYGSDGAATYGGFYSGFTFKPQITFDKITTTQSSCIPNSKLSVSEISGFDTFQWYFNEVAISGATTNNYFPLIPGYYYVKATIAACGTVLESDKIPVSDCPLDNDNDGANNNIDIDLDNDGIINCSESFGNLGVNISDPNSGSISTGNYSNSFTGTISTVNSLAASSFSFIGKNNGDFITEVPKGKNNSITYSINFAKPISIALEYTSAATSTNLMNSDAEFIAKCPSNTTLTVLNTDNQLLIDTNYDGIYESGITQYSSFEIRFRLNSTTPLAAGTGTFSFRSYLASSLSITQKNLSDITVNKASFSIIATCIPKDSDQDGVPDQLDFDSDNDGIPDAIEAQGNTFIPYTTVDLNKDGLSDAYGAGIVPVDTDLDVSIGGVSDYLDLDSDNDGIYDLVESGSVAIDLNKDGVIDGAKSTFGTNGLSFSIETSNDSGILNYTIRDTDADGIKNYREIDSDNDLCNDVIEAGFLDPNNDGLLGNNPIVVNTTGVVTSGMAYSSPNLNYITAAPIVITTQPNVAPTCELENAKIEIVDNGGNTYQWQVSSNGTSWSNVINNAIYSGAQLSTLSITRVTNAMNGYKYQVLLSKTGNSCGLTSDATTLRILALPVIASPVTLVQCDDDGDGFSDFNLTEKNSFISSNYNNETFTYYTTEVGANTKAVANKINNPQVYNSTNATIWIRVENSNGCFNVAELNLVVSTTQIPSTYERSFSVCDDNLDTTNNDTDGISTFDFSGVTSEIKTLYLGSTNAYSISYYKNETDALAEVNEITNTSNYRNIGYPNLQQIWVRVESTLDNACYGLGPHITLTVNPKPSINLNEDHTDDNLVCSNLPTFYVQLNAGINDGSPTSNYTYIWTKDNLILAGQTQPTLDVNTMGTYAVEVTSLAGCSRTRTIKVIASDIARISSISIVDISETNTITINATGQGHYQYSLDAPTGPFQDSNFFDNVSAGLHDVYIRDKNGCGTISQTIAILGLPKYFTPNNDGYNDYWNVKGVNAAFNSNSIIFIYDRYGKLITQIKTDSSGWDGNFNGQPLPSDDYWYTVQLEDGREAKGHFSLKR